MPRRSFCRADALLCRRSVIQVSTRRMRFRGRISDPALPVVCGILAAAFTRFCSLV